MTTNFIEDPIYLKAISAINVLATKIQNAVSLYEQGRLPADYFAIKMSEYSHKLNLEVENV